MAKKTKDIQNGDVKSNIVVLRSVYGKVGQKYFIQPQRDPKTGRFPACVKRVNSQGDIILTPDEIEKENKISSKDDMKTLLLELKEELSTTNVISDFVKSMEVSIKDLPNTLNLEQTLTMFRDELK